MGNKIQLPPLQPIQPLKQNGRVSKASATQGTGGLFGVMLRNRINGEAPLKISAHAQARLASRGIEFDEDTQARLTRAVSAAAAKGARSSLILLDGTAMVVSVTNRTVITVMAVDETPDNVFTDIDSAVIAGK